MKKFIIFLAVLTIINAFAVHTFAKDSDFFTDSIDIVIDEIDETSQKMIAELGLSDFTYEELYNINFSDITDIITSVFKGSLTKPLNCIATVSCVILIFAVAKVYVSKENSISVYLETVCVLFSALLVVSEIISVIKRTVTVIESLGVLMKLLVPILAVIISFSGSPTLALSYNATTVYVAQIITAVCRDFLTPILIMLTCVAVCVALNNVIKTDSLLNAVKKIITMILGLSGTVFTGFVTIKDFLASGADKVSVKGVKFLIGSSVPVVGSALSEGLSSVIASVSLMKNTFGVIAIIIISVLILPVVSELIVWIISLSFLGCFCEMFSQNHVNSMILSLRFVFSTLLSVILFTTYILIVSTGLTIVMGNN